MAHYHFHVNPGPKGKGADHAQYITREGRFKEEKYGEIGEKESGNLPPWARGSAARFFAAADEHERANGNSYRELELALPVELSDAERGALVRETSSAGSVYRPRASMALMITLARMARSRISVLSGK